MSANAIFNVTQALKERLQQALLDAMDPGTVFVGPLDDIDAKGASLILFLYRIAPNPSLRNREHIVLANSPPLDTIVYDNALPLILHYLITVGTRDGTAEDPLLRLLGFAMRALNDTPELTGPKIGHETVRVSLEPISTEEMSRIWTLFPVVNYRTSVAYVATPVWIDPRDPPLVAARVINDRLGAGARLEPADV
jgi:Pvc16 N-terminal domain